jgi:hypothetical protein
VRQLLAALSEANVKTGELFEGERRVAFLCWDPDVYQVEVFSDRSGTEPIDS